MSRQRSWTIELHDGRKIQVGIGDSGGIWLDPDMAALASSLIQELTSSDAERIGQTLFDAAAWLAEQKPATATKRRKAKR